MRYRHDMVNLRKAAKTSVPPALGELLPPPRVAERLGVPETTLTDWRLRRRGPPFVKVQRLVRYPSLLLDQWLASRLQGAA